MLPTSAGVEPATSWSSVGRRIQLSHRGRLSLYSIYAYLENKFINYYPESTTLECLHMEWSTIAKNETTL